MSLLDGLIAYAVLSYIVVGINWVRADYHPAPWRLVGALFWWPGWLIGRVRHSLTASAPADSRPLAASTHNPVPGHE